LRSLREEDVDALLEKLGEKVVKSMPEDEIETLSKIADKLRDFAPSLTELLGYGIVYKMFGSDSKSDSWDKIIPMLLQLQQQNLNLILSLITQQQNMMLQMMQLMRGRSSAEDMQTILAMQQNMLNTVLTNIQNLQNQYNKLLLETEKKERRKELEDLRKTIEDIKKSMEEKINKVYTEIANLQYLEDQYQKYKKGEPIEVALETLDRYEKFRKKLLEFAKNQLGMEVPRTPEGKIDYAKMAFDLIQRGFSVLEKYIEQRPKEVRELPIIPQQTQAPQPQTQKPKAIVILQTQEQPKTETQKKIEKALEEMFSGAKETGGESEESTATKSEETEKGGSEESSGEE